jgi:hypothetical protein
MTDLFDLPFEEEEPETPGPQDPAYDAPGVAGQEERADARVRRADPAIQPSLRRAGPVDPPLVPERRALTVTELTVRVR